MISKTLKEIEKDSSTPKTQLVIVAGLLVLAWFFDSIILVYCSGIIALASFISPLGNRIVCFWYKLAEILGWINSRILLSFFFYLIVTPIGILFRLFGNDPLLLKDNKGSMYNFRGHQFKKEDLENPW